MRASIPPEIAEQLASNAFIDSCMASFDQIDVDKSNSLEPSELAPVVVDIVGSLLTTVNAGAPMSVEECLTFVMMCFDQNVRSKTQANSFLVHAIEWLCCSR